MCHRCIILYHIHGARNALKLRNWRTNQEWIVDKQRNNTARFTHDSRIMWRVYKSPDLSPPPAWGTASPPPAAWATASPPASTSGPGGVGDLGPFRVRSWLRSRLLLRLVAWAFFCLPSFLGLDRVGCALFFCGMLIRSELRIEIFCRWVVLFTSSHGLILCVLRTRFWRLVTAEYAQIVRTCAQIIRDTCAMH